jgi:hypothetical protein
MKSYFQKRLEKIQSAETLENFFALEKEKRSIARGSADFLCVIEVSCRVLAFGSGERTSELAG